MCAVAVVAAGLVIGVAPAGAAPAPCDGWQIDTLAHGLEQLENLEPDGRGGFYLSGDSKVYRIDADGAVHTIADHLAAPGGLQRDGSILHFLTRTDGKLWRLDTTTGALTSPATPTGNALLRMPDHDMLTSWVGTEGGPSKGVTRYRHRTGAIEPNWSTVPRAEGLASSPDHRDVYTDDLFTGQIYRIPVDAPDRWSVIATLPPLSGPDDLTMSRSGDLYVAAHLAGTIYRVDPGTGAVCAVANGLPIGWGGPSSVRIAPDGAGQALYVTSFDGTLRRLRPPAGTELEAVTAP